MADLASLTLPIKDETTGVVTPTRYDIPTGGSVTVDSALSSTSENPVQNKVIKAALDGKADAADIPAVPVQSVNGYTGAVVLDAEDVGASPAIEEVTVSTAGAVTQALEAGKVYHFTGALTALTISLAAAASGLAQYHFDFLSGSTAPTLTMPNVVTMPDSFTVEANKRYEVDILNNYGAVLAWAIS